MKRSCITLVCLSVVYPLTSLSASAQEAILGDPVAERNYELPDARFAFDAAHAEISDHSSTSTLAARATLATRAERADLADLATVANRANLAARALRADVADRARRADRATFADHAATADFASSAGEAEFSISARTADFSTSAGFADTASFADFSEVSETSSTGGQNEGKLPFNLTDTFTKLAKPREGETTLSTVYNRPENADTVMVEAYCLTDGEDAERAAITINFDSGHTARVTLCDASDTTSRSRENQYRETVQLFVPFGATQLTVRQTTNRKGTSSRTISETSGSVTWFGPASLAPSTLTRTASSSSTSNGRSGGGGSGGDSIRLGEDRKRF